MDRASPPLAALLAVQPQWTAVNSGAQALGLQAFELLHAGPPLENPRRPPPVLRSSVVMTCLHEGWAQSESEAEHLISRGRLQLSPAQDRACVTPLAAVVSAGTPVFVVRDAAAAGPALHAPVATVGGPDARMGGRDAGLLARLRHRDEVVAPALKALLAERGPVALLPAMAAGLRGGDDLHSRTTAANEALLQALRASVVGPPGLLDDMAANPLYFLTLWMAACALMLRAAEGGALPGLVTRAGGNGEAFAIALAARPGQWISTDDVGLDGPRLPGKSVDTPVSGAIGDSAVIDMLGLGGQRLRHAPEPLSVFSPYLRQGIDVAVESLLVASHPALSRTGAVGLDAQRVGGLNQAPLVVLAMLAADGVGGFLGRGVYRPPVSLFERAVQGLDRG